MSGFDDPILNRLVRWGEAEPLVRAMILTSSRAVPGAPVDEFSDYDVILVLDDIRPFYEDAGWMVAFGQVLANYRDPLIRDGDHLRSAYVTQFDSGLKIDFTLLPSGLLRDIASSETLPPEFDAGYAILLDKDGLADGIRPPELPRLHPGGSDPDRFQRKARIFLPGRTVRGEMPSARRMGRRPACPGISHENGAPGPGAGMARADRTWLVSQDGAAWAWDESLASPGALGAAGRYIHGPHAEGEPGSLFPDF